jgi:hypothetical protein
VKRDLLWGHKRQRRVFNRLLVVATLGFLTLNPTQAQFVQQGSKLVGTGIVGLALQGFSVAVSADGNTAIVGGGVDNGDAGAAWVFTRSGGVWTQQGTKLVGTGAVGPTYQGWSVSISNDGNTAIVGGEGDSSDAGAAWVFTRSGGVWTQQGAKLVGTGAVGRASQGSSVSLSADGNTAIVGGSFDNNGVGGLWVFTRTGAVWNQSGGKLVGIDAVGSAALGRSASVSSDGNTAIVGGYGDNSTVGAAWVFTRSSGGAWSQQGTKLVGSGAIGGAWQGISVSLSSDGNSAIVGGYGDNGHAGAAWVFTRSEGVWTQQGAKLVGSGAIGAAWQGISVSLSSDGNTAIVGGYNDNSGAGATWIFTRSSGVWTQLGSKLVGTGAVGAAFQGTSVGISGDGSTAIVGGYSDNSVVGAAWVFTRSVSSVRGHGDEVPLQFILMQSFPNPFNPTTTIRYALPARSRVILSVYNSLSQLVSTLVKDIEGPGNHEVKFDGTGLARGVYFYRLQSDNFVKTQKLLLLR